MLKFPRGKFSELVNRKLLKKVGVDGAPHIGCHSLDRFFAYFRPMALFVVHAALLTTHSQGAGFTNVF
jgi:hypothetical protein